MMQANSPTRTAGTAALIVFVGLLLVWSTWTATRRPVRIDDDSPAQRAASLPDMRLNLNTASAAELSILPGLGPALAQRIVDDRERRGAFANLDDLKRVSGIGPALVNRMRAHVVVE